MKRLAVALSSFALVAAACGGGSDNPIFSTETDGEERVELSDVVDAETLSAIDTAIDDLGPDGAFRAALFAMDDGYDSAQITESMVAGTLDADGSIGGAAPNGPAFNLIDRSGPSARSDITVLAAGSDLALGPPRVTPEEFKRDILDDAGAIFLGIDRQAEREADQDQARAVIGLLITLGDAGYDLNQIVEHFVFGSKVVLTDHACAVISENGTFVVPAGRVVFPDPREACPRFYSDLRSGDTSTTTTTSDTSTDTSLDGDEGGSVIDGTYVGSFTAQGIELVEPKITIVLEGSEASATVSYTMRATFQVSDAGSVTCTGDARSVGQGTGTVTGSTVRISLTLVSGEVLGFTGSGCLGSEEFGFEEIGSDFGELVGTFSDKTISGMIGGFLDFSATR